MSVVKMIKKCLQITPTISTSIYASGHVCGGLFEIKNFFLEAGGVTEVIDLEVFDGSNQNSALQLVLWPSKPAGSYADGSAFSPSLADLQLIDAVISVLSTGYISWNSAVSAASLSNIRNLLQAQPQGSIYGSSVNPLSAYGVIVLAGTPTYATTKSLSLQLGIEQH